MGKHVAPEGAPDPIVADALAHRPADPGHHAAEESDVAENPVGWPGEPAPEGGGIGWPGDLRPATAEKSAEPSPARRSWRRWFSSGRVA